MDALVEDPAEGGSFLEKNGFRSFLDDAKGSGHPGRPTADYRDSGAHFPSPFLALESNISLSVGP